jgi:chemotaxis protein CheX
MDEAVAEVFESMLQRSCRPTTQPSAAPADIFACISFSGTLEAQCVVAFPTASAQRLAGALLRPGEWDVAMLADAVGELCNMIAGGWKRRLGAPGWEADLSAPSISRAPANCGPRSWQPCIHRTYTFDNSPFAVTVSK